MVKTLCGIPVVVRDSVAPNEIVMNRETWEALSSLGYAPISLDSDAPKRVIFDLPTDSGGQIANFSGVTGKSIE